MIKKANKNIKGLMILSSIILVAICSLTFMLTRGTVVQKSLGATCTISASPSTIYFCANRAINQQSRVALKFTNVDVPQAYKTKFKNWEEILAGGAYYNSTSNDTSYWTLTYTQSNRTVTNKTITVTYDDNRCSTSINIKAVNCVKKLSISASKTSISVGEELKLTANVEPTGITGFTWKSSDTSVATVDSTGKVIGKKAGTATITVTKSDRETHEAKINITVTSGSQITPSLVKNPNSIACKSTTSKSYEIIAAYQIQNIKVKSYNASEVTYTITNSSNKGVLTVKPTQKFRDSVGNYSKTSVIRLEGYDTILKQYINTPVNYTIIPDATSLSISKKEYNVKVGETICISSNVTVTPKALAENNGQGIVYSVNDSSIAQLGQNGCIKGLKDGKTTMQVKTLCGNVSPINNIVINVGKGGTIPTAPTKITLSATPGTTINYGGSVTISHTVTPSNADKTVKYTYAGISGQPVATTGSATIKNLPVGTHTIYAISTRDTSVKGTITITVIQPVTGITLKENGKAISAKTIDKNGSFTLTAEITPSNATDRTVTWTSMDTNVATVVGGYVKAKAAGTTTITAKTPNGKSASIKLTVKKDGSSSPEVQPTGVTLSPTSATIYVNNTKNLTATVIPSNASDKRITWSSSDTSVATVSNGVVTGKKAGTATITAKTTNGKTATSKITVKAGSTSPIAVTGVSVSPTSTTIEVGETVSLTETISPSNATDKTVTWTSSSTSVATVNSSGVVTGKKVGTATITVKTSNGKTATSKITVKASSTPIEEVTSVKINPSNQTIDINEKLTLTATVTPDSVEDKSIEWSSSAPTIATVSSSGVVTGKKAGTAIITGRSTNGKTGTAKITVTSNISTQDIVDVDTITVVPSSRTINTGAKLSLLALITPSNATDKTVIWTSSDVSIATVSSSGIVTGESAGTVTITATTLNGKESTSVITVNQAPSDPTPPQPPKPTKVSVTGVDVTPSTASILEGEIISLSAVISPSNATNKTVKWSSSDSNVATVNASGVVTGKSAGTAEIIVTTVDGNKKSSCYVTVNKKIEIIVDPVDSDEPSSQEEPSNYEPSIYEDSSASSSGINSTILIICICGLILFLIGAIAYFVVRSRNSNSI